MLLDLAKEKIAHILTQLTDFFWGIGYFGWQIAVLYALHVCTRTSFVQAVIFGVTLVASGIINQTAKRFIDSPRPADATPFLVSEASRGSDNGMPSGHAQLTSFALLYAYLLSRQNMLESAALLAATVSQRLVFKNHTLLQVAAGTFLGSATAVALFYLVGHGSNNNNTKKKTRFATEEKDCK
jgi:membrane-associated phospholipid phosphatase